MTQPSFLSLPQRLRVWEEQWKFMAWQLLCETRVALPCTVTAFDAVKQTVQVQPMVRENILLNLVPTPTEIGLINDVPVLIMGGGDFSVTFPIAVGDECLVIFADMDFSAWWATGNMSNQEDRRRHDLSDGFAIFRPRSQAKKITNYSTDKTQIRSSDGSVVVELGSNEITVKAPTVTVNGSTQVLVESASQVTINGSGHTTIEGKDFLTHKHSGVQPGAGQTGPVV